MEHPSVTVAVVEISAHGSRQARLAGQLASGHLDAVVPWLDQEESHVCGPRSRRGLPRHRIGTTYAGGLSPRLGSVYKKTVRLSVPFGRRTAPEPAFEPAFRIVSNDVAEAA